MAFPKKGLRKITVNGTRYAYRVTGNDGFIGITIGLLNKEGQLLTGTFSYHANKITNFNRECSVNSWTHYQRIKITPDTIRQVIECALKEGWNPEIEKGQFFLKNIDEKIDLNLKEETKFPQLNDCQVAVSFASVEKGKLLNLSDEIYVGVGDIYHVIDTIEEAKIFAKEKIQGNPDLECWIIIEKDKAICYLNIDSIK